MTTATDHDLKALHSKLAELLAKQTKLDSKIKDANARRKQLQDRLAAVEKECCQADSEVSAARASLEHSLQHGKDDEAASATAVLETALNRARAGAVRLESLSALRNAIEAVDAEMVEIAQAAAPLAEEGRVLARSYLAKRAEDADKAQKEAAERLAAAQAHIAALSSVAEELGAGPASLGPVQLTPLRIMPAGTDWAMRAPACIDPSTTFPLARSQIIKELREQCFSC
ncbi:MAG: hypothetical protein U1E77_19415 [Inhella sp.]